MGTISKKYHEKCYKHGKGKSGSLLKLEMTEFSQNRKFSSKKQEK